MASGAGYVELGGEGDSKVVEMMEPTSEVAKREEMREEIHKAILEHEGPGMGTTVAFVGIGYFLLFFSFGVILATTYESGKYLAFSATSTGSPNAMLNFVIYANGDDRVVDVVSALPTTISVAGAYVFPAGSFPLDQLPAFNGLNVEVFALPLQWKFDFFGAYFSLGLDAAYLSVWYDGSMILAPTPMYSSNALAPIKSNFDLVAGGQFDSSFFGSSNIFSGKDLHYSLAPPVGLAF
jgi:hypothetical protein